MKMRTTSILGILASLIYVAGLSNASAFYDPGTQRWLNRDPLGDIGSLAYFSPSLSHSIEADVASTPTSDEALHFFTEINQNPHTFGLNNPINSFDAFGLDCGDIPAGEPGGLDAETIEAADTRTAGEVAQDKLRSTTINKLQQSKIFGNGPEGAKNVDINKLKQLLNRDELQKAREIAKDGIKKAQQMLKNATNERSRQAALRQIETQLNRADACKKALGP